MHLARDDRDGQLVEALRRREDGAAECLVATFQARAYRLAVGIAGNAQDAEEVVQDAFWTVIRKIDAFRGDSALGSWLYRIVVNGAYSKLRRRGQRREIALNDVLPAFDEHGRHAEPIVDWSARVDDPSHRIQVRLAMSSALDEMPVHYRAALVLRDMEGMSSVGLAEALGIRLANARTRVHRARLFVRKRLEETLTRPRAVRQLA